MFFARQITLNVPKSVEVILVQTQLSRGRRGCVTRELRGE
jgi:hypothetical protein